MNSATVHMIGMDALASMHCEQGGRLVMFLFLGILEMPHQGKHEYREMTMYQRFFTWMLCLEQKSFKPILTFSHLCGKHVLVI